MTWQTAAAATAATMTPLEGPATGGTPVTFSGTFSTARRATTVTFGGIAVTQVTCAATTCTVAAPAHAAGAVSVTVNDGAGTAVLATPFTYRPVVTRITPTTGPSTGGTSVRIDGSGFSGTATVAFGTTPATQVSCTSTRCIATSPAGLGSAPVIVTVNGAAAAVQPAFAYTAPTPTLASITPTSGSTAGGTTVGIVGTGFFPGATAVTFGGVAGTVTCATTTNCTATTPAHTAGAVPVVATVGGQSSVEPVAYTYTDAASAAPVITGLSPSSGPEAGRNSVTVSGTGLTGATIRFGTLDATGSCTASDCAVTAPAGTGSVPVTAVAGAVASNAWPYDYVSAVQDPPAAPITIVAFPQRDFVSAEGYADDDRVVVRVLHNAIYGSRPPISTGEAPASWLVPQAGIVEVNHPGGGCWSAQTPDIRPGDRVQIEVKAGTHAGRIDETIVRNVTARRPVQTAADTVVVHGLAQDSFSAILGNPLPLVELEQRIVAPGSQFELNQRRTLRATAVAGADGVLAYDPISATNPNGLAWTATYTGLSTADVTLALGAETRGMWLGPSTTETTVYEIGALTVAGPQAPCAAPFEVLPPPPGSELVPPTSPSNLSAVVSNSNTVTLNWTASTDPVSDPPATGVTAYGIYRGGDSIASNMQPIFTVSNADGSAPAPTSLIDRNTPPGSYFYAVRAFDAMGNASGFSNVAGPVAVIQQVDPNTLPVCSGSTTSGCVNDPPLLPINLIVFPSRDFISAGGFANTDTVTIQLLRRNAQGQVVLISGAEGIIPVDGAAEVNHPGGACWEGVTPEIRVGDIVRTIAYGADGQIRSVDQTHVAGVTAFRPVIVLPDDPSTSLNEGVVEIHGSALGADGLPLPLGEIEQRMIATHGVGLWEFNGRRSLRAGPNSDGTLAFDAANNPMGIKWTATYTGLSAADVDRMALANTRIHWLGRDPTLLNEATIFENADGDPPGPAGPACTRPLEAADLTAPTAPAAGSPALTQGSGGQVTLNWLASSDDWAVAGYRAFVDGVAVANILGTTVTLTVAPGGHSYAVAAYDGASPRGPGGDIIAQIAAGFGNLYGNVSTQTTLGSLNQADVAPPSVPANLVGVAGAGGVTLTWSASSDNVGVTGYRVYRGGTAITGDAPLPADPTGPTFVDATAPAGANAYAVDAVDAAGNRSAQSAPTTVNLGAEDLVAPTVPANVQASTSPDLHGRNVVVTWSASTDAVGVTGYGIYRNGSAAPIASVNGTTLTFTNANLPPGTYSYTVDAFDSAGNRSTQSAPATAVVANDPPVGPHSLTAFPSRDFISASGYTPGANYVFALVRGAQTYLSAPFAADVTGTIEVNHPGGTCWNLNTPNLRPGDVIRIIEVATGLADQTTVADVTSDRPLALNATTVVVHGTARNAAGQPLPLAQVEQRLISSSASPFEVNGRRVLRTGLDGTIAYDTQNNPGGVHWTATYTGLSANDVLRAVGGTGSDGTVFVGAESRAHWLGRDPLALTEITIFENGPGVVGGPAAPCTAPAETPVAAASSPSFAPGSVSFANTQVGQTSAAQTVTFSNGGGATMTITNIYVAGLNTADFARSGGTCPTAFPGTLAAGASCSVLVTFTPAVAGLRQANLSFTDNAANTTDQTASLSGSGAASTAPVIGVSPSGLAFGTVNGGASANQTLTVRNTGAGTLTITALAFSGAAAADFTRTGGTCSTPPISIAAPTGSCTIVVTFRPGAIGNRTASLVPTHNAAPATTSTAVGLSGTGGAGSVLTFDKNPVQWGTVDRNTTRDQTITVKNSGTAAATLSLASFGVTGAGYSILSTTCAALAVNNSCNVVIRFTAPATVATFNGTLTVTAANGLPPTATTALTATTR